MTMNRNECSAEKTVKLLPNKTSTITITYEGKECKLKVKWMLLKEYHVYLDNGDIEKIK